jgi:hypothetical protein
LKKTSPGPLRQGQRLDTSETKPCSNKERKPPNQSWNTTKSPPAHMQAPPKPKHTPPEPMQQCNTGMQQRAKICSPSPGRLDRLDRAVRPPAPQLTAWGRLDRPRDRPCTKLLKICPNQFEHLPNTPRCPKHAQTSLLPLVDNA